MSDTPAEFVFMLESVTAGPDTRSERVHAIEEKNRPWVSDTGVQALGIGQKVRDGVETSDVALRVYVAKKKPKRDIENPVPKVVPGSGDRPVATDVIEIGEIGAELFTGRSNPLSAGVGVGNGNDTAVGTLGALVRRRSNGKLALLSNSHVIARDGLSDRGEEILQPAPVDGGVAGRDRIARLTRAEPFEFTPVGFPNLVDAAIAELVGPREKHHQIRLLGEAPVARLR